MLGSRLVRRLRPTALSLFNITNIARDHYSAAKAHACAKRPSVNMSEHSRRVKLIITLGIARPRQLKTHPQKES